MCSFHKRSIIDNILMNTFSARHCYRPTDKIHNIVIANLSFISGRYSAREINSESIRMLNFNICPSLLNTKCLTLTQ